VSTPTSPFAIRDYRFYWFARLLSTIAQMAMVIVIGWQVYDIARQTMDIQAAAFQLGLIGLVQFAPLFLLTLVSGWTADRIDRRYIARAVLALEMLCADPVLGDLDRDHQPADPVRGGRLLGVAAAFAGRRSARSRPISCRARSCPRRSR
jgi:MFS family permease